MPAPFFFSYAHNDALDRTLDQFYEEVSKRVRFLTGKAQNGFRDAEDLRSGDVWSEALAAELMVSPAMVCLYSPSYFLSKVCGQELQIFLDRRRLYQQLNAGSPPGTIVPVLWQPTDIPWSLPDFQYERPPSKKNEKQGVWYLRDTNQNSEFKSVAQSVAVRIKEAMKYPLPTLGYKPVLGGVGTAFGPPALPPPDFDGSNAAVGPECATFIYAGTSSWKAWPFAPAAEPLLHIGAAVAKGRDLESRQLCFDPAAAHLVTRTSAARARNNLLVVLVDGTSLSDVRLAAELKALDAEAHDACCVLVGWPSATHATAAPPNQVTDVFPKQSVRQPPFFYPALAGTQAFADAVAKGLDALKLAVLKKPMGAPVTPTSPFVSIPSVQGPGGRQAAA
jgi:hypothetical protein